MGAIAPALPWITAITGLIGAGTAAYGAFNPPKKPKAPAPPPPPPQIALEDDKVTEEDIRRRRMGRQETILTRGALSDAPTYKPTLLGQ